MNGAVAAGHPLTVQAGAQVLEAGGNAVDACVAAAFAAGVAESPLTGPGAGGFLLVHRAQDPSTRLAGCFVVAPGLRLARRAQPGLGEGGLAFRSRATTPAVKTRPPPCAGPRARAPL